MRYWMLNLPKDPKDSLERWDDEIVVDVYCSMLQEISQLLIRLDRPPQTMAGKALSSRWGRLATKDGFIRNSNWVYHQKIEENMEKT